MLFSESQDAIGPYGIVPDPFKSSELYISSGCPILPGYSTPRSYNYGGFSSRLSSQFSLPCACCL